MREHTCSPSQDPRWCWVLGKPEPLRQQSLETAGGLIGHGGWELQWLAAQEWLVLQYRLERRKDSNLGES